MIWIINFPCYYVSNLFNYQPYCLIDTTPLTCIADTNTPYQLIIKDSPKIITFGNAYMITIMGLACPRSIYMNNVYPDRYIFIGVLKNSSSNYYS